MDLVREKTDAAIEYTCLATTKHLWSAIVWALTTTEQGTDQIESSENNYIRRDTATWNMPVNHNLGLLYNNIIMLLRLKQALLQVIIVWARTIELVANNYVVYQCFYAFFSPDCLVAFSRSWPLWFIYKSYASRL